MAAASLALTIASGVGLAALAPGAAGAETPAADSSAVTVAWFDEPDAELRQYQPARDPSSAHHAEFKDLRVTVSRNSDLVDEAVTVTVTGMPGPTRRLSDYYNYKRELGANYIQAMQCWGDPADPEFYKNCLYGGWSGTSNDSRPGVAGNVTIRGGDVNHDVPFRAVTGEEYSSLGSYIDRGTYYPILDVFAPQTTNERYELVNSDGSAEFLFEVQSVDSQPYLGCGDESSATGTRCWLVIVPRGTQSSAASEGCKIVLTGQEEPGLQQNSPVNPDCDYWSNRVVVPLDFRSAGSNCPPGSVERLVVGSDTVAAA
ncbi:MAG: hypothetical protein LBD97_10075, partial [Bifidobacteriaceae bacterium]|nr:hypothetical protein [Bifidobacteriaceae bacterium]